MRKNPSVRARNADLSIDQIIQAAIELLDEGGLELFSMRALAERLGRSTMAAYRHVDNREALIQLAADAVQDDLPDVDELPWYDRLAAYARHGWTRSWRVHPWVVDYIGTGPITPQSNQRLVAMERVFHDAGFADDQIAMALIGHWSVVAGTLRLVITTRQPDLPPHVAREDAIFEFNLRAWIAGLSAVACGLDADTLARQGESSRKDR